MCPVVWGSTTWWGLSLPNDHWLVSACCAFMCTRHTKIAAQSESRIPLFARDGSQPAARKADRYHTTVVKESECPLPHSCSKWKIKIIHTKQYRFHNTKYASGVGGWSMAVTHANTRQQNAPTDKPANAAAGAGCHSPNAELFNNLQGDYQVRSMKETNGQNPTFQCLEYSTKNDTLTSAPSVPWIHSTKNDSQMPLPFKTNHYMKHSLCD